MNSHLSRKAVAALVAAVITGCLATAALSQAPQRDERPDRPAAASQPATSPSPAAADSETSHRERPERPASTRRLPSEVVTDHAVDLPGRTLRFKATAGSLPINDAEGTLQAEIAYVAYAAVVPDGTVRPVTFVFNGGPGAASAYLHLGALGPWRLPFDHVSPSAPPSVVANADTWLDFTDLVFIDPVGTGYSHLVASSDNVRRRFWSVDGDAESLAVFIRKWLEKAGRQTSAKFIVGESYGGFRSPKVAKRLQANEGVGISGLVLVSPVLDFGWRGQGAHSPLSWAVRLPSMAATVLEAKGAFDRDALRDVEHYAAGEYLLDLLRGERDTAAVERISARVASYTGLDPTLVRRLAGRVDMATFQRERNRQRGLVGSAYDPTVTGFDPYPTSASSRYEDPMLGALAAPLTSAMSALYQHELHWQIDAPYHLLDREVSSGWNWGGGRTPPEVVDDLRSVLAGDRQLRVLIAHGASDLVTPYFENQLIIDQLPAFGPAERLKLVVYGGGHMFYSRDASRHAFRDEVERLFRVAREPTE